jgi:hypothetical protein
VSLSVATSRCPSRMARRNLRSSTPTHGSSREIFYQTQDKKSIPNILEGPFSIQNSPFKTDQLGVILEPGLKEIPSVVQKLS